MLVITGNNYIQHKIKKKKLPKKYLVNRFIGNIILQNMTTFYQTVDNAHTVYW